MNSKLAAISIKNNDNSESPEISTAIKASLKAFYDELENYVFIQDEAGMIITANKYAVSRLGYTMKELLQMNVDFIYPEQSRGKMQLIVAGMLDGSTVNCRNSLLTKKKKSVQVDTHVFSGKWGSKEVLYWISKDVPISARENTENAFKEFQEKYRRLIETTMISIGDGVISTDTSGKVVFLNKAAEKLTGWTQEEARGKLIKEVFNIVNEETQEKNEDIVKKVLKLKKTLKLAVPTTLISKNGVRRPIEDSAAPIVQENGKTSGVVLVFRDFSEQKKKQDEIAFLSYHDQLTGLHNRRFYEEELSRMDTERNFPITIMMADVNGLKLTNDAFGHKTGDVLLKKIAAILQSECRADEIIARTGGDEFVLLLPKTDAKDANKIVDRIQFATANEIMENVILSISIGFAVKKDASDNMREVCKKAEDDMYKHKLFESASMRSKTIDIIMNSLFEKNNREMLHSKKVSEICVDIATKMMLKKDEINLIRIAGLMHDIGKIGISDKILNKVKKLNRDEWREIMRHSEIGYRILSSSNDFSEIADCILEHHEKWNGKGYPKGLKGEEISLAARIITVADSYAAMTSDRTYRQALSEEAAIASVNANAGIQFDPAITKVFVEIVSKTKRK